jgi:dGTPase
VAKSLGSIVGKQIIKKYNWVGYSSSDFGEIVAAASLAHDIGNPPLGHAGEDAVIYWFKTSDYAKKLLDKLSSDKRKDFESFEGNAQGFRILTRLQRPDNKGGMQLTCAMLATFTKYPIISSEVEKIKG